MAPSLLFDRFVLISVAPEQILSEEDYPIAKFSRNLLRTIAQFLLYFSPFLRSDLRDPLRSSMRARMEDARARIAKKRLLR